VFAVWLCIKTTIMANGNKSKRMLQLARKWQEGTITEAEKKEFDQWYNSFDDLEFTGEATETPEALRDRLYAGIKERVQIPEKRPVQRLYTRIAAAASILVVLSLGGYLALRRHAPTPQIAQNQIHDIAPGGNKATLTLSDGRKIVLTDVQNGTIASQGHTLIKKTADGRVSYDALANEPAGEVIYNTLSTKRAEQYSLTLPDGSRVWLNSESSVRYPVAFTGTDRTVELTGEAYFEVAHNASRPFRVKVNGELVEDIGTSFNINAYDDEPAIKTTLVEGAVKVSGADRGNTATLKPGEQAISHNGHISVKQVDVDDAVAWQHGYFQFNEDDLESAMRKIARWYDVEVVYNNEAKKHQQLAGTISRYSTASQVLKKMELTGAIHFDLSGRKIIVK